MDIDQKELMQHFEEWARTKGYPEELWSALWDAYFAGFCAAPGPYDFLDQSTALSEPG